jgi:3-methylfumaryl-CoA hydratase
MDIAALQDWIGRSETAEDEAGLGLVRRLAALLDLDPRGLRRGDPLPIGWHAVLFWPLARQSALGPDGHPERGDFMPPIPLPRRMFAGRRTWFRAPIRIGADVTRVSTIAAITPKSGRSGQMVFVTLRHGIMADGVEAVVEEQDLVYREAAQPGAATPAPPPPLELPAGAETIAFTPSTTLLFRYSAVTYNGHRIHYDADYAREAEGYPALVVNGGLTTILLTELAKRKLSGPLARISSRAGRALYVDRPARLACHAPAPGRLNLWALDEAGRVAFEAVAESA